MEFEMNFKKFLVPAMAAILLASTMFSCSKDDDNDDMMILALLYLATQSSVASSSSTSVPTGSEDEAGVAVSSASASSSVATSISGSAYFTNKMSAEMVVDATLRSASIQELSLSSGSLPIDTTTTSDKSLSLCSTGSATLKKGAVLKGNLNFTFEGIYGTISTNTPYTTSLTNEITNLTGDITYTDCVMKVFDLSQGASAFPAGSYSTWPTVYVKITGTLSMSGSGSYSYKSTSTYSNYTSYYSNKATVSGSSSTNYSYKVTSSDLQSCKATDSSTTTGTVSGTASGASSCTLGSAVALDSTMKKNGESSFNYVYLYSNSTYTYTGSFTYKYAQQTSGTIGGSSFSVVLADNFTKTDSDIGNVTTGTTYFK